MPQTTPDPRMGPSQEAEPTPPPPVPGHGRPFVDLALRRLQSSWVLRGCAIAAFMGYGGLIALVVAGHLTFSMAGFVALLSLASWFFLFWWYPVLERTLRLPGDEERRRLIGTILEFIAVGCVVLVHLLMAIIVVHAARS